MPKTGQQGPLALARQVTVKPGQGAATAEWVNQSKAERCRSLQSRGRWIEVVPSRKLVNLERWVEESHWGRQKALKNRPDQVVGKRHQLVCFISKFIFFFSNPTMPPLVVLGHLNDTFLGFSVAIHLCIREQCVGDLP